MSQQRHDPSITTAKIANNIHRFSNNFSVAAVTVVLQVLSLSYDPKTHIHRFIL
jgi:hypothetical protein